MSLPDRLWPPLMIGGNIRGGRPFGAIDWPSVGMTSADWLDRPVRYFAIQNLVITQAGLRFDALCTIYPPIGGDPYPHVVIYQKIPYLEDGHHRLIRAMCAGNYTLPARWISDGSGYND